MEEAYDTSNEALHTLPGILDAAVIGGGLAGLALSIQLAKAGYTVALFEKETYPFHKVCGEYVSLESLDFIGQLGLNLKEMNLPLIKKLLITSPGGMSINSELDLGGVGVSRFVLDHELYKIALQKGVTVYQGTKVNDVVFANDIFTLETGAGRLQAGIVAGTFGKRSNLDVKLSRQFIKRKATGLNNYIGIKYHVKTVFPADTIALHNFKNGYCGIAQIEDEKFCLCYLTTAENLKTNGNSIKEMEKNVLQKNPSLKKLFSEATFLYTSPVTISQISFDKKTLVEKHVLMIGDAAGMITPLCGNGMSMALHGAKLAFENIDRYLKKEFTRQEMEDSYKYEWNTRFTKRLRAGRIIQRLFGKEWMTDVFIGTVKYLPFLTRLLIRATHGKRF